VFDYLSIASATIDRIVHCVDVLSLRGNNYRLKKHRSA
jgi:DNA replication protein DnaC